MLFNRKPLLEDWAVLFRLLQEAKIRPLISGKFSLLTLIPVHHLSSQRKRH